MGIQIDLIFDTDPCPKSAGLRGLREALGRRQRRVDPTSN
jgi:hypothetical protein